MDTPDPRRHRTAFERATEGAVRVSKSTLFKSVSATLGSLLAAFVVIPDWLLGEGSVKKFLGCAVALILGYTISYIAVVLWKWLRGAVEQRDEAYALLAGMERDRDRVKPGPLIYPMFGIIWRYSAALGRNEAYCEACHAVDGRLVACGSYKNDNGRQHVYCPQYNATRHEARNITQEEWQQGLDLDIANVLSLQLAADRSVSSRPRS